MCGKSQRDLGASVFTADHRQATTAALGTIANDDLAVATLPPSVRRYRLRHADAVVAHLHLQLAPAVGEHKLNLFSLRMSDGIADRFLADPQGLLANDRVE